VNTAMRLHIVNTAMRLYVVNTAMRLYTPSARSEYSDKKLLIEMHQLFVEIYLHTYQNQ